MTTGIELAAPVIDVNAAIGPDVPARRSTGPGDLLAEQQRSGIGHSLVRGTSATRVDRAAGNRLAREAAEQRPDRLSAVAVASTLHGDRLPGELTAAVRAGARAVWVEHRWEVDTEAGRRLLRAVLDTGLPLLVPHRRGTDASRVGELTAGTGTPVVLVEARYPDFSEVLPALDRYHQLHLETSSLGSYQAIESIARVAGHERLLFGSGAPVRTPRSPLQAVLQSELPGPAQQAVLGGNAARVFGLSWVPATTVRVTVPPRLFDVHGHFFPAPWKDRKSVV